MLRLADGLRVSSDTLMTRVDELRAKHTTGLVHRVIAASSSGSQHTYPIRLPPSVSEGPQKGPQVAVLRSLCGPESREQARNAANTVPRQPALSGIFARIRGIRGLPTNRGARIRTGDLADPNGARYQAAPRPDAPAVSHIAYVRPVPPVSATEIISELDQILESQRFDDYGPNGLQVPGASEVTTLATGVSANVELFEQAVAEQAQLLLVHHGLFWGSGPGPIDATMKRRLKLLFDAELGLAAYHLPLDAHPQYGNNALIARALGATKLEPFALHHGEPIGFLATLADADADHANPGEGTLAAEQDTLAPEHGIPADSLFARVRELTARDPLVFDAGPPRIRKIAIVSGAGSDYLADAAAAGADALLTGEPAERAMAAAREANLHFIAAGHYATETFGVNALGEHLAERFGIRHVFLDVPNPI
jgi:dinuclear metal center YbgI/SA1388 family protein